MNSNLPQTPRNRRGAPAGLHVGDTSVQQAGPSAVTGMFLLTPQLSFGLLFLPLFQLLPIPPTASPGQLMMKRLEQQPPTPKKLLLDTLANTLSTRKRLCSTATTHSNATTPHTVITPGPSSGPATISGDNLSSTEDELWTAIEGNTLSTTLTSIYEEPTSKRQKLDHKSLEGVKDQLGGRAGSLPSSSGLGDTPKLSATAIHWTPQLDKLLVLSHEKLDRFKSQASTNGVLKKTSHHKIISRMLFSKTGVVATPHEIGQRLQYLGSMTKGSMELFDGLPDQHSGPSPPIDLIDREIALIFSPTLSGDFKVKVSHCDITYHHRRLHRFAGVHVPASMIPPQWPSVKTVPESALANIWRALPGQALAYVDSFFPHLTSASVFVADHRIDLAIDQGNQPLDLISGVFKLALNLHVSTSGHSPPMSAWKCVTKVWDARIDREIYGAADLINGYKCPGGYDVQVPFLRQFLAGYFNFLINGGGVCDLTVCQVLFDSNASEPERPYALLFHKMITGDGSSEFFETSLNHAISENLNTQGIPKYPPQFGSNRHFTVAVPSQSLAVSQLPQTAVVSAAEIDDNETVLADSSPYRATPAQPSRIERFGSQLEVPSAFNYGASPGLARKRWNMTIDIDRANAMVGGGGPMTAPVYNAELVAKYNFNSAKPPAAPNFGDDHHGPRMTQALRPTRLMHRNTLTQVPQYPAGEELGPGLVSPLAQPLHHKLPHAPNDYPQFHPQHQGYLGNPSNFNGAVLLTPSQLAPQNQQSPEQFMLAHRFLPPDQRGYPAPDFDLFSSHYYQNSTTQHMPSTYCVPNKENIQPPKITFGPILEYDPTRNGSIQQHHQKRGLNGQHRFPANPSVTFYKGPKQ